MLPSQSISAIVAIVIICYSHLGLNNQNIAHNSSKVVEAVHLENGPIVFHQNIDSIEKSDHNFYLPLEDERIKLSSAENKRDTSKLSSTNTKRSCPSVWKTFTNLQAQSKQQCFFYRRSINKNGTTIKSVTSRNTTSENCERSLDFYKTDDEPKISKENVLNMSTSQMKEVNKSKPASDNIVDDIILNFKSASPVSAIDMLSFDEWRKKISEQMNKATAHNKQQLQQDLNLANEHSVGDNPNNPVATQPNVKIVTNRARNFASYECGAKVVDSNSEADFVNRVLNEQTDEYMLNPCKTKNWFVIELCETIQPQYMELANFELYSSIPKEFSVSASEHYPARNEWSVLGSFISNDVRTVQGFKLHNNGFVKYLRIQLNSYYGSEHFCPISVIRVFGTSLFDEVERIDKPESMNFANHDENAISEESMQNAVVTPDIIGSAKNAVFNIFKKAFSFNIFNRILENFSLGKDSTFSFNVVDQSQVIKLYSSFEKYLSQCENFFINSNQSTMNIPSKCIFLRLFFPEQLFDMLYTQYFIRKYLNNNLLFQCSINTTYSELNLTSLSLLLTNTIQTFNNALNNRNANKVTDSTISERINDHSISSEKLVLENVSSSLSSSLPLSSSSEISPSIASTESSLNFSLESLKIQPTIIATAVLSTLPLQATMTIPSESSSSTIQASLVHNKNNITIPSLAPVETKTEQSQLPPMSSDSASTYTQDSDIQSLSSNSGQSKEAVIIRLTNRIKNLETNISLMSTYLEKLSVRYRMQMEDMQLIFNKTIDHLNNTAIRAAEKDAKQQEFIMALEKDISQLKKKVDQSNNISSENWFYFQIHVFLLTFELIFVAGLCRIFYFIFRRTIASMPKTIDVSSDGNGSNINNLNQDEVKLISKSNTLKISLHRSKSLSDLGDEFIHYRRPTIIFSNEKTIEGEFENDCDKENTNVNMRGDNLVSINCRLPSSNISDLTSLDRMTTSKILKAVNN